MHKLVAYFGGGRLLKLRRQNSRKVFKSKYKLKVYLNIDCAFPKITLLYTHRVGMYCFAATDLVGR